MAESIHIQHAGRLIRLGIVGLGHIGRKYARMLLDHQIPGAELYAVYTSRPEWIQQKTPRVKTVHSVEALMDLPDLDGLVICTPHRCHVAAARMAVAAGIPVLIEKPLAAVLSEAEVLCREVTNNEALCGVCYNMRLHPVYRKIKQLMDQRSLGEVVRFKWEMTAWYRTQAYYDSAGWRGTWGGEGGGVLLNQCSHHLDLLGWWFGMPLELAASCCFGKFHHIEVEDEATVFFRYPRDSSGILLASTGERCGVDRLEIIGTEGRIEVENDRILMHRFPVRDEPAVSLQPVTAEPSESVPVSGVQGSAETHADMLKNFVKAIRGEEKIQVPVHEACLSLMMANAAIMSEMKKTVIELPLNAAAYDGMYAELVCADHR